MGVCVGMLASRPKQGKKTSTYCCTPACCYKRTLNSKTFEDSPYAACTQHARQAARHRGKNSTRGRNRRLEPSRSLPPRCTGHDHVGLAAGNRAHQQSAQGLCGCALASPSQQKPVACLSSMPERRTGAAGGWCHGIRSLCPGPKGYAVLYGCKSYHSAWNPSSNLI